MSRTHNTPAPVATGLRFVTATVPDRLGIVDRIIAGPAALGPSREGPSFDQDTMVGEHEFAVCYLDSGVDWAHGKAHWAVGTVGPLIRWLMDEAAVSGRRRGLIVALALRKAWATFNLEADHRPLEHSVVDAIDAHSG
jgi:hypothetical protein